MKYLDLNELNIKDESDEELCIYNTRLEISADLSVKELYADIDEKVKLIIKRVVTPNEKKKTHRFEFVIPNQLDEENFETVINLILAAFFKQITLKERRPREWRLGIPEIFQENVHCGSWSLLKNAINYNTIIDKFQLTIFSGDLHFVFAGGD